MTKVHVVTVGTYSDYHIDAIFSSKELAYRYLEDLKKTSNDDPNVEEWELDTSSSLVAKRRWCATIDLITGELKMSDFERFDMVEPNQRTGSCTDVSELPYKHNGYLPQETGFNSYVSQEHANKLAVEARQEFIRRIDLNLIRKKETPIMFNGKILSVCIQYSYDHPDYAS